jgi:SOS-response transcriptional repressor LexA
MSNITIDTAEILAKDFNNSEQNVEDLGQNNLSYRLKYAMNFFSLNQSELARRIGIKPQIIQYLCSRNITHSKFTHEIADALGVDYRWLSTGEGQMITLEKSQENYRIPLIKWNELNSFSNSEIMPNDFIFANIANNKNCFAVILNDNSMEPRIGNGTILVLDRNFRANNNDFVLVRLAKLNNWVLRQIVQKNNEKFLVPINTQIYKTIKLENNDLIFALMVQTIQNF